MKPYVFTHVIPGLFTSAVSIFAGGSSFRWIRDALFGLRTRRPTAATPTTLMNELAAPSPVGANKLLFNPEPRRGQLPGAQPAHPRRLLRASTSATRARTSCGPGMEGIALNLGAVLEVLRRFVPLAPEMLMVGGGSKSALWRQIFADVYRMDCVKTNVDQEAGSLGAAAVAAVGAGLWKGFEKVDEVHKVQGVQKPIPAERARPTAGSCRRSRCCAGTRRSSVTCCTQSPCSPGGTGA